MKTVSRQGEWWTKNHWHIRPVTYPLCYQKDTLESNKLTASLLFERSHARRCGQISFEIRRYMGGSVATSNLKSMIMLTLDYTICAYQW